MTHEAFGSALRRRRMAKRLSLQDLATALHYSKGQLSKVENNLSRPSSQLVRLADRVLEADGALIALAAAREVARPVRNSAGQASIGIAVRRADAEAAAENGDTELVLRQQFDLLRGMGRHSPPGLVIHGASGVLELVNSLRSAAREPAARARLDVLAARYGEYLGWMAQEAGHPDLASQWTRWSVSVTDDDSLAAYALVREAELAMYNGDGRRTISLSRAARRHPGADARIRGLASHRMAQGYAISGDYGRCRTALDEAEEWLARPHASGPANPVLGSSTVADLGRAVAGWCLYDLGRPRAAAESLESALARTPDSARRARALYGARLALAHEAAGELTRMCEVAEQAVADAVTIDSASVRGELRTLARRVLRRRGHRPARRLHVELTTSLSQGELLVEFPVSTPPRD
ncbi:transcriptional regulator with XRE-family HTH domain [Saccharothrix ecbatanensis]|uniref:Transcriptional regulator with XRE-family HTH domain n=1 Tax=Saccharothrix ecbatanensis TaxID=1105145 RepID=A0A7W9M5C3_9PSEU|nr:helix-turn-helix transcriptional regulator [Saccharothrix ecbatanensis]MBB5807943.1 transcriptional regulator with XRE-family HTH domain [Saccharothrix ecbatanensis]